MKGRDEGGREIEFCHDGWMGSHVLFQIELDLLPRPDSVPNKEGRSVGRYVPLHPFVNIGGGGKSHLRAFINFIRRCDCSLFYEIGIGIEV